MFIIVFFIGLVSASSWWPPTSDTSCDFTRDDSLQCLKTYVDVNPKDDKITKAEIDAAVSKYLPTYLKPAFWWIGSDKVIKDCDYDKNGYITPRDWLMSKETCFPHKKDQCTIEWFCKKAAEDSV